MVPIVGPSYTLSTRKADVQRSVNLYLTMMETGNAKAGFIMDSMPGLSVFCTVNSGPHQAAIVAANRLFVVSSNALFEVFANGTSTSLGSVAGAGVPSMAYGLTQLVIVNGVNGYVLNLTTNVLQPITSSGFYGSPRVRFLDNYFLFVHPSTQQFYISAINNALLDDPLDFASAEGSPDNLVTLEVDHSEVWLFGELTTEVWFDAGAADFPFQRNRGAAIEIGCQAAASVQKADNSIFWIGRDVNGSGIVYRSQGFQARRVSTQAVEQALQASSDLSSATAYTYEDRGLTFYCINAPGLTSTWCYEVSTGTWHERCDLASDGSFIPLRTQTVVSAFGKRYAGGSDGVLYLMDANVYQIGSSPLVRMRVTPHSAVPGRLLQFFSAFYLDCTTGEAALGVDAFVELSWSKDSGASWSNSLMRSIGKTGQRFSRLLWTLLGSGRDRVWRVKFSGNAPFSIVDGGADSTPGVN